MANILLDLTLYLVIIGLARPQITESFLMIPVIVNTGMICGVTLESMKISLKAPPPILPQYRMSPTPQL